MFTAVYMPSRPEGVEDPSRSGFATQEEAEEYVISQMCKHCQEERRKAIAGEKWEADDEDDDPLAPSKYPGCYFEWLIGKTEEMDAATSMDELMQAGGWETVYRKDNTPEQNAELQAAYEDKKRKRVN